MRLRVALLVSLGLNLALLLAWFFQPRPVPVRRPVIARHSVIATNILRTVRTNVIVQPQLFSWKDIESGDYLAYIQNLRSVGCPRDTIRDIIVADVNQLFARRRATEVGSITHQWWRSDPDPDVLQETMDKVQGLEKERRELLTFLLGPHWETAAELASVPDSSITLDGPLLSDLSVEARQAVRDLEMKSAERRNAYARAQTADGKPVDPAELARLRAQTRDELAKVLTPAQLEEYLLRYSNNATQLREALRGFSASQDEFRAIFHATDSLDSQLQMLQGATDPASVKRRQELEQQKDDALKQALPLDRYALYKLNQDPGFQQARDVAEEFGASPETALSLYQLNQASQQERRGILQDPTLSAEDQARKLAELDAARQDGLRQLLGEEAAKSLLERGGK